MNENLKMSSVFFLRFDLVFILLDRFDEYLDKRVLEYIMVVSNLWVFGRFSFCVGVVR